LSCARTSSLICLAALRLPTLSSATSVAMTLPPSLTKLSAIARPMPCPAAVTSATLPCSRLLILSSCGAVQCGEAYFLVAQRIEIVGHEPAFEIPLARRPFGIEHRKPGIVTIAALGDHVLAERAFVDETVAQCGAPRWGVKRIALPFIAAVGQRLRHGTRQKISGFGAQRREPRTHGT